MEAAQAANRRAGACESSSRNTLRKVCAVAMPFANGRKPRSQPSAPVGDFLNLFRIVRFANHPRHRRQKNFVQQIRRYPCDSAVNDLGFYPGAETRPSLLIHSFPDASQPDPHC
jgi:hypothetical protein